MVKNIDRSDPGRFFGDGATFKAKLIGILEVGEARGDRMCQEALQDLKMAIRAAGEHKQRITIHVTIDGLRLRDEKTADSLYHHPVHKISFIAQDMTDSRAFGYIFGSPDSGHRFFGIKTDKAASQVVLAMRDLFQVVFELKKKEIEMARQQIQSKAIHEHQPLSLCVKNLSNEINTSKITKNIDESVRHNIKEMLEPVADLVDLEQELSSIQRGITQMERITPSEPTPTTKVFCEEDPFGDSFTNFPAYNLLPPPECTRSRLSKSNKTTDSFNEQLTSAFKTLPELTTISNSVLPESSFTNVNKPIENVISSSTNTISKATLTTSTHLVQQMDDSNIQKINEDISKILNNDNIHNTVSFNQIQYLDAFSDLDPLGTGKIKPYIDKKFFFHELKNPPKKILKELSDQESIFPANFIETKTERDICNNESLEKSITDQNYQKTEVEINIDNFTSSSCSHTSSFQNDEQKLNKVEKPNKIELSNTKLIEPIILTRDTDPFSPTRKKSDLFQDNIFNKIDPFESNFSNKNNELTEIRGIISEDLLRIKKDTHVFNELLLVNLPPENWTNSGQKKSEKQTTTESPNSASRNRPSVFKQNTVDVINSISSKKMPHLFGQKFSKRDSNNINMRRLQESDSLSETEAAPEPPPRLEINSHIEPPPLPPKKQFSEIVIRPRITSSSAIFPQPRYEYVSAKIKPNSMDSTPPIPFPLKKISKTDSNISGPERPVRKYAEEDYLAPISSPQNDVPPLLPPPQTKNRSKKLDCVDLKFDIENEINLNSNIKCESILPDITLSQLLTLGIDDLAVKLNVPTVELSKMTLVELTNYLSEFIDKQKNCQNLVQNFKSARDETPVFKVNFTQNPEAFIAKFDDNFGKDLSTPFVGNSLHLEVKTTQTSIPPADRYAVFREIIDEEEKQNETAKQNFSFEKAEKNSEHENEIDSLDKNNENSVPLMKVPKIENNITETISHAKDRYAALRDIILVEDLFSKSIRQSTENFDIKAKNWDENSERSKSENVFDKQSTKDFGNECKIIEIKCKSEEKLMTGQKHLLNVKDNKENERFIQALNVSNRDDIEINELMNRAVSKLSLDSHEHLSPNLSKSPNNNEVSSTYTKNQITSENFQCNDVSTSPIQTDKSTGENISLLKSSLKSPILQHSTKQANSGYFSEVICASSPEANLVNNESTTKSKCVPFSKNEAWADFDKLNVQINNDDSLNVMTSLKSLTKEAGESPCSSDGKDDWKENQEYSAKRHAKGHTSSSSRDLSPWDDEASDYKKKITSSATDRRGYYMRHARRMNSCDDDYDYEEEMLKRRDRRIIPTMCRSRENFELDAHNWYPTGDRSIWSPPDDETERSRPFDRSSYERCSYGSPFEKRYLPCDRRDYKGHDKRKYYREYSRPDYEAEFYGECSDVKERKLIYYGDGNFEKIKSRRDYENIYQDDFMRDGRIHKFREYFYDRDRKSFDQDSLESYESIGRRQKFFGSGDVYSTVNLREDLRERYVNNNEKSRSLRKEMKIRGNEEYDQDSENEIHIRRNQGDTVHLQKPIQGIKIRKSNGSSPWDGEELMQSASQRGWKRPSSASETERRLAENRRVLGNTLSGSDGEKEKRFRKKSRSRCGREIESRRVSIQLARAQNLGCTGYDEDYDYSDDDKFEKLNRHRYEVHQRIIEIDRRKRSEKCNERESYGNEGAKYLNKEIGFSSKDDRCLPKFDISEGSKKDKILKQEVESKILNSNNFSFEDCGFESDFNSPQLPCKGSTTKCPFRFSNDFSDKEKPYSILGDGTIISLKTTGNSEQDYINTQQTPIQKLRFDDKVTISKFKNEQSNDAFEDDFSNAEILFENENHWNSEQQTKNHTKTNKWQDNFKKSESVNIFAPKVEDPFEDDDFFNSSSVMQQQRQDNKTPLQSNNNNESSTSLQNDSSFAKFDENM